MLTWLLCDPTNHAVSPPVGQSMSSMQPVPDVTGGPDQPEEEEVDIDLEDPEVQQAAVKIQAGFRRHLTSKQGASDTVAADGTAPGGSSDAAGQGETSSQQGAPPAEEEEEVDIDLNDPDVADAAAKIQAGFRRHMKKKWWTHDWHSVTWVYNRAVCILVVELYWRNIVNNYCAVLISIYATTSDCFFKWFLVNQYWVNSAYRLCSIICYLKIKSKQNEVYLKFCMAIVYF